MAHPHFNPNPLLLALIPAICLTQAGSSFANSAGDWTCTAEGPGQWQCKAVDKALSKYSSPVPLTGRAGTQANAALLATGSTLDWYPRERLTTEQLSQIPAHCEGAYLPPPNDSPSAGNPYDLSDISARANTTNLDGNDTAVFEGSVEIFKGDLQLRADKATLNRTDETLTLEGNVVFRDTTVLLMGERADIQLDTESGQLYDATFVRHIEHSRGTAEKIDQQTPDLTVITKGNYTTCEPDSNAWTLSGSEITLDEATGRGTAKHARIKIKDVPVLYSPYLSFPIDDRRRTGFLWPNLATAKDPSGSDITVPFYLNISPDWDATVAARHISERGTMSEGEVRHLNTYSDWIVAGAYLDDDVYGQNRWLGSVHEYGRFAPDWWHRIDYTEVSDVDYMNDLSSYSLDVQRESHLRQSGSVGFTGDSWLFSAAVTDFQTLRNLETNVIENLNPNLINPYTLLPQVQLQNRPFDIPFEPQWLLYSQATYFDTQEDRPRGSRLYAEPGFSFPMTWTAAFFEPTVKMRAVSYELDPDYRVPVAGEDTPSEAAPMASLDGGLFFERDTSWFNTSYTQTLEPRAYYLYSDAGDQSDQPLFDTTELLFDYSQLFRESRFSGFDRIDDSNQATLGVTSRFFVDATGRETFSASIGQIFYFEDRVVNLGTTAYTEDSSSEIAGEIIWRPSNSLSAETSASWDPDNSDFQRGLAQLRYISPSYTIFNLGYRFQQRPDVVSTTGESIAGDINETEFSTIFPITRNWSIIGQLQYDLANERDIEQTYGFEYDSCCWKIRVIYQEGLDAYNKSEYGVYLQIELKGLGGSGNKVSGILDEAIFGFREREEHEH